MQAYIDFESRSACDIKKAGAYRYAEDETTEVLMLSVKPDNFRTVLWVPEHFRSLINCDDIELISNEALWAYVHSADIIHAWNAQFERCIWREIMHKRYGFPDVPLEKWSCSAARAAACGLPRDLARAGQAMGVAVQKDEVGHKLMMKMCKPRKPTKNNSAVWHETSEDFTRLALYCLQDSEAEYALGQVLPELSERERQVWLLDQKINDRGVAVDLESIEAISDTVAEYELRMLDELRQLTGGEVQTAKQVAVLRGWLAQHDIRMDDLQKQTVDDALACGIADPDARRVLEIRSFLSKSSTAKLESMKACVCADGRVHGTLLYCGASTTGRWAGRLIQPQNLPRGTISQDDKELALFHFNHGDISCTELEPMEAASSCIRSLIYCPGGEFACGDFSAIEARVTAWLANEQKVLSAFQHGKDIYKVAASGIYGVPAEEVSKEQRQIGKVAILACLDVNTLVVTDQGNIPLKDVTTSMRVWDGEAFVCHSGVAIRGEKHTIDILGLSVTPDHLISIGENQWTTAGDLKESTLLQKLATDMGSLSYENWRKELWGESKGSCANALADGSGQSPCTIYEKERPPVVIHALKSALQSPECTSPLCRTKIPADCSAGLMPLCLDATTPLTLHIPLTGEEESGCTPLGTMTKKPTSNTSPVFPDGTTRNLLSTASTLTTVTSPATSASYPCPSNNGTKGQTCGLSIKGSVCSWLTFIVSFVLIMRRAILLRGNSGREKHSNKSFLNKKSAGGNTRSKRNCWWSSEGEPLPCLIFGESSALNTPSAAPLNSESSQENPPKKSTSGGSTNIVGDLLNCGQKNRFTVIANGEHVVVHNCGFAGGVGAFQSMAKNYGVVVDDEKAKAIVQAWRQDNQNIVSLWYTLEAAAGNAVQNKGQVFGTDRIRFMYQDRFLMMKLPSGRILRYLNPRLEEVETPWGAKKILPTVMQINPVTNQWERNVFRAGVITENCFDKNTLVITGRGVLPITEVKNGDLVWDGDEWVHTKGCVSRGFREVIEWQGIQVTQEHLIFDGKSWRAVIDTDESHTRECLKWAQNSVNSSSFRRAGVTIPEQSADAICAEKSERSKLALCIEAHRPDAKDVGKLPQQKSEKRETGFPTSSLTTVSEAFGCIDITASSAGVVNPSAQPSKIMGVGVLPCTKNGWTTPTNFSGMPSHLTGGIRKGLSLTESTTTRVTNPEISESYRERRTPTTDGEQNSYPSRASAYRSQSSGNSTALVTEARTQSGIILQGEERQRKLSSITREPVEVFDLLNCGQRSRFTVLTSRGQPVVVHNCVQATARDFLVESMFNAEAAGLKIVLTIHDEILAEGGTLDTLLNAMRILPAWAQDIPIEAAGWQGKRYRKD